MKSVFILLGLAAVVLLVLAVLKRQGLGKDKGDGEWPFHAKRPLSLPEQVLYHRLVAALPGHIVLAQVQVSRVLGVKKGFNFHEWNNRINRLSYDFVVCAKDATVLAAIELDDKTHDTPARVSTDSKKNKATAAAGVRLIRWQAKALPDLAAIRSAFPAGGLALPTAAVPAAPSSPPAA